MINCTYNMLSKKTEYSFDYCKKEKPNKVHFPQNILQHIKHQANNSFVNHESKVFLPCIISIVFVLIVFYNIMGVCSYREIQTNVLYTFQDTYVNYPMGRL